MQHSDKRKLRNFASRDVKSAVNQTNLQFHQLVNINIMDAPPVKKQRIRSKNFTMSETEVLHSLVKEHMHVLSAKHCSGESGITKKMQDQVRICNL